MTTYGDILKHYTYMHERTHYGCCPNDTLRAAEMRKFLEPRMAAGETVLDCSAGRGIFSRMMAELGYKVTATEADPWLIDHALSEFSPRCLRYDQLGELAPERWDAVVSIDVLEHLFTEEEVRAALQTMASLSRRWLCISVGLLPSHWHGVDGNAVTLHYVLHDSAWWNAEIAKVATIVSERNFSMSQITCAEVAHGTT